MPCRMQRSRFLTARREYDNSNGQDSDFTSADIFYRDQGTFGNKFNQLSSELRLAGGTERLNLAGGGILRRREPGFAEFDSVWQSISGLPQRLAAKSRVPQPDSEHHVVSPGSGRKGRLPAEF